jgi:hypothetical protein
VKNYNNPKIWAEFLLAEHVDSNPPPPPNFVFRNATSPKDACLEYIKVWSELEQTHKGLNALQLGNLQENEDVRSYEL